MTEVIFQIINFAVLPFWVLMIFAPAWHGTRWVVGQPYFLLPWLLLYAILVLPGLPEVLPLLLQPKVREIAALLAKPEATLIGWIHFVAFDLFVGRWIYLDSRERGLSAWLVSPLLFLTLMLGPCGLLGYLLVRLIAKPKTSPP